MTLYATWEKTAETVTPAPTPEENKGTELSTKVENSEVEVKVELEKAVEKGSKLQIVKVAEEKIEEVKKVEEDLKTVFDINVVSNTGDIIKIEDNKMQIKILLEEDLRGYKNYQVVYIKDGKIVEEMPTKIEGNYIVFETTHLSEYGIVANNNEKVEEAQKPQTDNKETQEEANKTQNPQTGDNVVVFGIIFVVAVLGLAISTIISKKK
jgi:heme-binding NEAT domain protein